MLTTALPHLADDTTCLTDGGVETTLVFLDGLALPEFAAFPLLDSEEGRAHLGRYFAPYLDVAARSGSVFLLGTPTWRANRAWGAVLGYDEQALADLNHRAVELVASVGAARPDVPTVLDGVVGPRGDGYVVGGAMGSDESADYHSLQARAFASAGAQMMTGLTMTYADEAIGLVQAGRSAALPTVVSFTVETDGRLPSGQPLGEAVDEVDARTDRGAAYFMVNCAHPAHFAGVLESGGGWVKRVRGIRANASRMSHAELDEAPELDRGDEAELASEYARLWRALPDLRVAGGCCGTDHAHVAAIAAELSRS